MMGARRAADRIASKARTSAAAAQPPLAHVVTRLLPLAEERLIGHDRLARVVGLPVRDIGRIVGHADHQARGLGDPVANEARAGGEARAHSAATAAPPNSWVVTFALRNALSASRTP